MFGGSLNGEGGTMMIDGIRAALEPAADGDRLRYSAPGDGLDDRTLAELRTRKAEITRGALSYGQTDRVGMYTLALGQRGQRVGGDELRL